MAKSTSRLGFEKVYDRFHVGKEPNEAFRFGWVVEVDPHDPDWQPRKRTALGRMRREGATPVAARDGRIAVYSGEDIPFEFVYKFVSKHPWNPSDRLANRDLLDEGTLYVARFLPNGRGEWLALVQGLGPLQPRFGWNTQADVLVMAIEAAYQRGATKMDRPEGIAADPESGKLVIALTKNEARGAEGLEPPDAANPRANNRNGHLIELDEDGGDSAALQFSWRIFMLCGDPKDPSSDYAGQAKSTVSALSCPDNLVFDERGHLWIATDGQPGTLGINDGLYAVPIEGAERGRTRRFLSAVAGAEVTGPSFTPGGATLFVAIQHPGEGGSLSEPISSWPDGKQPTRPGVLVVQALDGRPVGSPPPA
jgi:secreted PhoX family phosphatase